MAGNSLLVVVVLMSFVSGLGVGRGLVAGIVVLLVLPLLRLLSLVGGVGGGGVGRGCVGGSDISLGRGGVALDDGSGGGRSVVVLNRSCSHHLVVHMGQGLAVHNGIKSIDGIGGVFYSTTEAISIIQRVLSLHHIPIPRLHLALRVSGECILHIVGEVVLGMWVIGIDLMAVRMDLVLLLVDHMLGLVGLVQLGMLVVLLHRDKSSGHGCQAAGNQSNELEW